MRLDPLPTFETERLVIRQLDASDVSDLFSIFSDERVMQYWSSPPFASLDDAKALLATIDEGRATQTLFQWGLQERASGRVIGTTTIYDVSRAHRRAGIGYALHPDRWGRGLVREAVGEVLRFAFVEMDMHRMEADVEPRNSRSVRSLESFGFRYEGHQRERYWIMNEWQDSHLYGLLRSEWRRSKGGS